MGTHVHLTGFMGAGKTTVGRALAGELGWPFVDLDAAVETAAGRSIGELFTDEGEERFRELERNAVRRLDPDVDLIVAVGGGFAMDSANRVRMRRHGPIVWLEAPFDALWRRIEASGGERPLAVSRAGARKLFEDRLPAYADCDLRIECGYRAVPVVAREIALRLGLRPGPRDRA